MVLFKVVSVFKKLFISVLIIALSIAVLVYFQATKPEALPVEIKQKVWPVEVIEIQFRDAVTRVSLFGKVEASSLTTVSAPVTGVIEAVNVKDGEYLKQGQDVIALSNSDLELPFEIAQAEVAEAKARIKVENLFYKANKQRLLHEEHLLKLKQKTVSRNQELLSRDLVSQSNLDQAKEGLVRQELQMVSVSLSITSHKANLAQMQARLTKAKVNLSQANINLVRGRVIAPFNARVAKVYVAEGNRVVSGASLLSFYALDSLELRAKIPVGELPAIYEALNSGQVLMAELMVADKIYKLPLSRLAGEADASGVDGFFDLPDTLKMTRPGDLLQVALISRMHEDVFSVPFSALFGSDRLYVVVDGQLQAVKVQLLGEAWIDGEARALLRGDLQVGSQILVTHLPNAVSGLKVLVMN